MLSAISSASAIKTPNKGITTLVRVTVHCIKFQLATQLSLDTERALCLWVGCFRLKYVKAAPSGKFGDFHSLWWTYVSFQNQQPYHINGQGRLPLPEQIQPREANVYFG